jgi:hypothetical protein
MELLVIWIILAIVGAIVASNKGRSGAGWFFLCLLLTPVVILILLALPRPKPPGLQLAEPYEETKICPECAETVKLEARICHYCRYEFWHAGAKQVIEDE